MLTPLIPEWKPPTASSEQELLLYRSNLLGQQKTITNSGGGNTSAKLQMPDPLTGTTVDVLWVKGSGGDLASMNMDGFATLYLDKLETLELAYSESGSEDRITGLIPHCIFDNNPRAPSIDTSLHAFLPFRHIDHMHPDAVIALATAEDGEHLCRQVFGDRLGWLDWRRPGIRLALQLRSLVRENPALEGVVLGHHGLFTWADSSEACYRNTIATINQAIEAYNDALSNHPPFEPATVLALPTPARKEVLSLIVPRLRSALGSRRNVVACYRSSPMILDFVNASRCRHLSEIGTSCPDHFLRTKIRPLVISIDRILDAERLSTGIDDYRQRYGQYYERCRHEDSPAMRDANPVIILVPGIGMLGFAPSRSTARIATEFFENTIHVMAGAQALGGYTGLPEQEAFDIEYWSLEEAKLRRLPPPPPLNGRIALVTGAAGGIGRAVSRQLLEQGAVVICCDNDAERLEALDAELRETCNPDFVHCITMDVTDESSVLAAMQEVLAEYGGLDILVANAGIASAAAIEDTTLELWNRNQNVLSTGYFLVSREAFRIMMTAGGGSIVFIGSKNALASSGGAAAYSAAKAASLHLARCLALEGAPHGIRVNTVNPDAVIEGSRIWSGEWRRQRAQGYGIEVNELEEFYRKRSLLKRSVRPDDVAHSVMFFVKDDSSRSTGNILNVDGGNAIAFTR